jgi:hypothetical protein
LGAQPSGDPLGQRLAGDGFRLDHRARAVERLEPAGFLRAPVDPGQDDQRHGVGRQAPAVALQRLGALGSGFAGGYPQFEDAARSEQRPGVAGEGEFAPLEPGIDGKQVALGMAFGARPRADAVAGFESEQGFIAENGVERLELSCEVRLQLLG